MNKSLDETINKMLKEIEEKNFEYFDREKAIQQLVLQHNEIERLNNRINRAIAYIEAGKTFPSDEARETVEYMQNMLLDILKGSDKE